MGLSLKVMELGPVVTNCYLIMDEESKELVAIDPGWDGAVILEEIANMGGEIKEIWLTHGHFDHLGGVAEMVKGKELEVKVCMHPEDRELYENQGGAAFFGLSIEPGPEPKVWLSDGQILSVGKHEFKVLHTPGHTPGHVVFHCSKEKLLFSGDLIFQSSIGRTDLPGGSYEQIIDSIKTKVLILPDETAILSGHGPSTTVVQEKAFNPFI